MNALSPKIQSRIDEQRARLQLLGEVLAGISAAAEHDPDLVDAKDVVRAVRAVIDRVVRNLDGRSLQGP